MRFSGPSHRSFPFLLLAALLGTIPLLSAQDIPTPGAHYDKAIFEKPIPKDGLAFLDQFNGTPSGDLYRDKRFRKLMKEFVPGCLFHYGRDMPLSDALEKVFDGSKTPVQIRDGRYLLAGGANGPYLSGRGFLWIDLQEGIGLGGFYFTPTNGEPTPTLAVFSRQVKVQALAISELPPAFEDDLIQWSTQASIAPVTTRYFLNGANKRILLEHDEDFCASFNGAPSSDCMQRNADAAEVDEVAAYYLDQIHYATNGTAWTIGGDQVAWIQLRDRTCGSVLDPLGCRIRITREHTHRIIGPRRR